MTSTSTSPLRDLFRSNPPKGTDPASHQDFGSPSRLQKLLLRNKPTSADQDYTKLSSTTAQPRSILYNFIMAPGTSTTAKVQKQPLPSQQSSMLLPPLSLLPNATSSKVSGVEKTKQSKSGLFTKARKEPVAGAGMPLTSVKSNVSSKNRKPSVAPDKPVIASRPWGMWASGGSGEATPHVTISNSENVKKTKDSGARRIWRSMSPSRSDENIHSRDEIDETTKKKKSKFLKSGWSSSQTKSPAARLEKYEQEQQHHQIMLHPSSNISSRSVAHSRSLQHVDGQEQQRTVVYSGQTQCNHSCQLSPQKQTPSRFNVTIAVHDIFGVGKVTEMMLALFLAHDAFLCRRPFWLQCSILAWEAVVVVMVIWMLMMAIWTLMRVVGVAEIVVQGADDLVRGTLSVLRQFAQAIRLLLFSM